MEDLDQEPEEIPMDEVLAEIRHMLSQNTEEQKQETPKPIKTEQFVQKEVAQKEPDYFLLTPEMRCDREKDMSSVVQKQKERMMNKFQEKSPSDSLSPELIAWLNEHLPAMIEKALKDRK